MDPRHVELVERYADMIQIGARNMQNFSLLTEVGRTKKPVLLKRGMSATIEDLLMSAEYILSQGNSAVVLCERGVKGFDKVTRNLFDVAAVRGREGPVAPADHRRSEPRHRPARPDSALCPGRRRGRGRRRAHRSSRLPRAGQVRRPAGPAAAAIRRSDAARSASWPRCLARRFRRPGSSSHPRDAGSARRPHFVRCPGKGYDGCLCDANSSPAIGR